MGWPNDVSALVAQIRMNFGRARAARGESKGIVYGFMKIVVVTHVLEVSAFGGVAVREG